MAQLGVTLVRNFWSSETRRVQHYSISRAISTKSAPDPSHALTAEPGSLESAQRKNAGMLPRSENEKSSLRPASVDKRDGGTVGQVAETAARHQEVETRTSRKESPARNPFTPLFSVKSGAGQDDHKSLRDYEISQLRLTAIIRDIEGHATASLEAPNGRDFIINVGSAVGPHGGKVVEISQSRIVIAQEVPSGQGQDSGAQSVLEIRKVQHP